MALTGFAWAQIDTMEKYYANGGKSVREGKITNASGLAKYAVEFVPADSQFETAFASATVAPERASGT